MFQTQITHWVCDNANHGLWTDIGNSMCQVPDNASIGVKQIITCHTCKSTKMAKQ